MELQLQVKSDDDGTQCWDNSCHHRIAVDGGKGGYVIRGKKPDAETARAVAGEFGLPAADEYDVWVPASIIEG